MASKAGVAMRAERCKVQGAADDPYTFFEDLTNAGLRAHKEEAHYRVLRNATSEPLDLGLALFAVDGQLHHAVSWLFTCIEWRILR